MPRRKRGGDLASSAAKRRKKKESRRNETEEEHEARLQNQRTRMSNLRSTRSEERTANKSTEESRILKDNLTKEAFHYEPTKKYYNHKYVVIGKMNNVCQFCHAKKFSKETPGLCCMNGKIRLPPIEAPPQEFLHYMLGETLESKHFLQNIRSYNSCFQMTSFGATSTNTNRNEFEYVFSIQGQIYHKIGSLLPMSNEDHKFLQVYFIGNEEQEIDQRCTNFNGLRREIIQDVQRILHKYNQLIYIFKTTLDRMISDDYKIVIRADKRPRGEHERRFNAPQVDEVAIVVVDNENTSRDIIVHRRRKGLQRIAETHRSYDALQYPLIFLHGEDGYHFNIKQIHPETGIETNKKVTSKEFYAYRLMIRDNETYNHILNTRRLFQQFLVDMYAKIEAERMLYIRLNQKKLRTEEYIHLRDAIMNDGNIDDIGTMVILPSSYIGSPRHMHEYTQDAMTYVRKYGRPDLFITFTCNSSWPEIKEQLKYGQTSIDRHDIIARVFRQKQIRFIEVITKYHIFGTVISWMNTIEWQKRGLPHSHNLIWLHDKIYPTDIDKIIRAEFPDPQKDPELYNIVVKNMIHGPCGSLNFNAPCMSDGKCTKKYPKPYLDDTKTEDDGYPKYRRRSPKNGGFTAKIRIQGRDELEIDNQWVVPYNPLLSKMFQAHINVEYCNSVKSIKYICKYVNKGSDMAVFQIVQNSEQNNRNDEILMYQMGRYINSNEAAWRIFSFPIHEREPAVQHLAVHLENGQRVYFTKDSARKIASEPPQNTTLTAFFQLCQTDPFARKLLYVDVPIYYTWDKTRKIFQRRKQGMPEEGHPEIIKTNAIGRVFTVHPNNAECFYLRMLLHEIRGPTSFTDLRTVNGYLCQTYREACQRLGLLENDNHWELTLQEATLTASAEQIRELFAIILTTCNPSNPKQLWDSFKRSMSDDILYQVQQANPELTIEFNDEIFNETLIRLEDKCLAINNQALVELGMPAPQRNAFSVLNYEIMKEKSYNINELLEYIAHNKPLLNDNQKKVYDVIMSRINNNIGGIIYLDAPGGTGKTFLINLILAEIRAKKLIALALASSGIAATLMEGGRTAHSALQLPLNIAEQQFPVCKISGQSGRGQILKQAKIIIWDECTMAHKKFIEAMDRTLQELRKNSEIMGGALLILSGDFRQTLPVIPKSTSADEINACLKKSHLWPQVQILQLTKNMRVELSRDETTAQFAKILLQIGEGTYPTDQTTGLIELNSDFCNIATTEDELIDKIYPNIIQNYTNAEWLFQRAILATKNNIVDDINFNILKKIPGEEKIYKSIDTMTSHYILPSLNAKEETSPNSS
ncbi:uncharacterized protein LOC123297922 [Chrysoperla carnea]|uniref:uncharacterized protein LOC123297922 n=1 Tax=Chrysoperla carnea TaxID=189513 RepID=UPI001D097C6F|nr:uncharacterized protein LOC123297922 [Chrysoperla carnea]